MESPSSSNDTANDTNDNDTINDKLEAANLSKRSDSEHDYKEKLEAMKQLADRYEKQLNEERFYRQKLEKSLESRSKEVEEKVELYEKNSNEMKNKLNALESKFDEELAKMFDKFSHLAAFNDQQRAIFDELSQRYYKLSGHYEKTSSEMREEQIALPQTVPELQFESLRLREALIEARAVKEHAEEEHASEIEVLNTELQRARELLESPDRMNGLRSPHADELRHTISDLERRLNESQAECSAMGQSLKEYRQRCSQLQVELDTSEAVQKDFVRLSQHLQVQLEKIRQTEQEVRWQFPEDVHKCNGCENELKKQTKLNCLHCGKIFCAKCVENVILTGPNHRPAKVCSVCHTLLDRESAPFFSTLTSSS
ncbi:FYVE-type domain-containing protein [Aphelenchoides besseyi]|nr:FYVE-type domain-containing protein [Aphelenchoides besseyi]KAI6201093.1 FYVE-type domain-containing protein [Aphelenchoides besseyi]